MQFAGKLNEAELREATRMIRPKGQGRRMALSYTRLIIYAGVVIVLLVESFRHHGRIPPQLIAIRVLILVLVAAVVFYRIRKSSRDSVAKIDSSLPDSIRLESGGVRLDGPYGAQSFQPWTSYTGYREGTHIVLLQRTEKDLYNVLAISALSPPERDALRGLLQSYLPGAQR